MSDQPLTYSVFGLNLRSEIALQELIESQFSAADVTIRLGSPPAELAMPRKTVNRWSVTDNEFLFAPAGIGRFYVSNGTDILVESFGAKDDPALRGFVLGSCMGAIFQQRRQLALHASSFVVGDQAFAICGKSGAGKSTAGGLMRQSGAKLLSDDVTVFYGDDAPVVMPGYPVSKLSERSLTAIGDLGSGSGSGSGSGLGYREPGPQSDKLVCPIDVTRFHPKPAKLGGIFILEIDERVPNVTCAALEAVQAMASLRRHVYRKRYLLPQADQAAFALIGKLIRQVPVTLIRRPPEIDTFSELEELLRAQTAKRSEHV
uniref:hypothetical protein n=1 Tax=uncultured Erythrobacter sp. TaxID=263913 RepID=UPI002613B59B|nr:hypothetical protein [uncultured Erythrobacter sp.]